jgi:outer membrane protein assembly factor BamB
MTSHALPLDLAFPTGQAAPVWPAPRLAASRLLRFWPSLAAAAALLVLSLAAALSPADRDFARLGGLLPLQQSTPDVPMFRGNQARTGEIVGPGPAGKPEVLWQMRAGDQIRASPVLVGGVLYAGSSDGVYRAVDAATGNERWRFETGGIYAPHPSVADGLVFMGDNNPGQPPGHGTLFAVDAGDGSERWHLAGAQTASPLAVAGMLYLGIEEGYLVALDVAEGTERWRAATGQISRGATFADGVVYAGGKDGVVYALDAADGSERWRYQTEGGKLATIAVADGMVYQATFDGPADQLYALDAATGDERWRFAVGSRLEPPAVGGGVVFLPAGDGSVYALNAAEGTVRWRFGVDDPIVLAPMLVGNTVYVAGASPTLYAVDAATGKERWHVDLDGPIGAPPIVSGGVIYVGTDAGSLYALGDPGADRQLVLPVPSAEEAAQEAAHFLWQAANGSEPIASPGGMAIAPDGSIWIAEGERARILIFSPEGAFREAWGQPGPGEGEFNFAGMDGGGYGGVGFDVHGNIYVLDTGNHRVQKFDAARQFVAAWGSRGSGDGEFQAPYTMSVDAAGNVYVGDDVRGDVQKFDGDGQFLGTISSRGDGDGQNRCIPLFGVDGRGHVYLPDCALMKVHEFDAEGNFVRAFGSEGAGRGQFSFPVDAAVDAAGRIFVSDAGNNRIQVFDATGAFVAQWGAFGAGDGQFSETGDVALDGAGNSYVIDYGNGRLQKFRLAPPLAEIAATPPAA